MHRVGVGQEGGTTNIVSHVRFTDGSSMCTLVHSFIIIKFTLDTNSTVLYYTLNKVTVK
jgi:hypothetical protein